RRPRGRGRRRGLLLASRTAARRRHRAARARAAPGAGLTAARGSHDRAGRDDPRRVKHAEQQIVVEGTPQECFEALLDYESFPEWRRAVKSVEVEDLKRRVEARGR